MGRIIITLLVWVWFVFCVGLLLFSFDKKIPLKKLSLTRSQCNVAFQCSVFSCKEARKANDYKVKSFSQKYGNRGKNFTCYYDKNNPTVVSSACSVISEFLAQPKIEFGPLTQLEKLRCMLEQRMWL